MRQKQGICTSELTIAKAEESDISTMQATARRVILNNYPVFLGEEAVHEFIESGQSDREIEDGIGNCFVMKQEDEVIGFAIVLKDLLHLIMIDVPYQNQGYGTVLLEYIEQEMFHVYSVIRLQSFESNKVARFFYENNGWSVQSREKVDGLDTYMLLFEKSRTRDESVD
ncbi:MAG: GNAT family N-acetyltransferase [Methanomicrobiales archaeon]|jgi:GNAT superfamily N-acetyltransferase|nr:GNAT family N-acetyltransferase [Methanomicrobiales archaeon]